ASVRHRHPAAAHGLPAAGAGHHHARRDLLRRHVRRLDDGDPRQHPGRGRLGGHDARRLSDGAAGARRSGAGHRGHLVVRGRHARAGRPHVLRAAAGRRRAAHRPARILRAGGAGLQRGGEPLGSLAGQGTERGGARRAGGAHRARSHVRGASFRVRDGHAALGRRLHRGDHRPLRRHRGAGRRRGGGRRRLAGPARQADAALGRAQGVRGHDAARDRRRLLPRSVARLHARRDLVHLLRHREARVEDARALRSWRHRGRGRAGRRQQRAEQIRRRRHGPGLRRPRLSDGEARLSDAATGAGADPHPDARERAAAVAEHGARQRVDLRDPSNCDTLHRPRDRADRVDAAVPAPEVTAMWRIALTLLLSLTVIVASALTAPVEAQPAYPTRPVEIIVAYAPGGAADVAARLVAAYASKKWGQPVNVVNMPGASGITGTLRAIGARPDGYTLLLDPHSSSAMLFAVESDVPFKMDGKTPIALLTLDPVVYTVKEDSPWKSLKDVAAAAKADPKTFRYGIAGVAGIASFSVSQFLYSAGVPIAET